MDSLNQIQLIQIVLKTSMASSIWNVSIRLAGCSVFYEIPLKQCILLYLLFCYSIYSHSFPSIRQIMMLSPCIPQWPCATKQAGDLES